VEGRTLAINVLVHADAETTRHAIERRTGTDWEETEEAEAAATADADQVLALVERDWADAHSSDRYSYMEEPDRGVWLGETFELHDGAYLGVRDHLRAYESPDGTYTAVQAHEEYYDWFRLPTRFRASTTRRSGSKTNSFTARSTPRLAASTAAWRAAGAMAGSL